METTKKLSLTEIIRKIFEDAKGSESFQGAKAFGKTFFYLNIAPYAIPTICIAINKKFADFEPPDRQAEITGEYVAASLTGLSYGTQLLFYGYMAINGNLEYVIIPFAAGNFISGVFEGTKKIINVRKGLIEKQEKPY